MLVALLIAPFAAALLMLVGAGRDAAAALRLAMLAAVALAGLAVAALLLGPQAVDVPWFRLWGSGSTVHFALSADGASLWLVLLSLGLLPPLVLAGAEALGAHLRAGVAALFALAGCLVGAFLAADLLLFYIFFEAGLVPVLVLVTAFGTGTLGRQAALQFVLYTLAGSAAMLVAIWYLAAQGGSMALADLPATVAGLDPDARRWCFFALVLAFVVKTPLLPLHGWQAPLYRAAPPLAAALIAGAMAKLGPWGLLRIVAPLFPEDLAACGLPLLILGLVSVLGGALLAMAASDLRRLLAFSSLSHLGLVVVGIASLGEAAMSGAVMQMVAHGLAIAALFLLVGHLEERSGRGGIADFGGLAERQPLFALLFTAAALASIALPGTAAFIGEVQLLSGIVEGLLARLGLLPALLLAALAGSSMILGAVYVLRAVQRLLYGPPPAEDQLGPLPLPLSCAVGALLAATLLLGLQPRLLTAVAASPAVEWSQAARALAIPAAVSGESADAR